MNSKHGTVHCIRCGAERRTLPSGAVRCHSCDAETHARRYKANPEKYRADARARYARLKNDPTRHRAVTQRMLGYHRKTLYGLSTADYEQLLTSQGGVCAICRKPPLGQTRNDATLHVDHDHDKGSVRGLLCRNCNLGIGFFEDDPALMESAILYLRASETRRTISLQQT